MREDMEREHTNAVTAPTSHPHFHLPSPLPSPPLVCSCRHSAARAVVIAFCLTFFSLFDIPVFWPILVLYFVVLFGLTMKNQISHMIKYRYIPWSWGKAKYGGGPGGIAGAAGKKGKGAGSGPVIAGLGIASSSSSLGAGTVAAGAGGSEPRFTGSNLK